MHANTERVSVQGNEDVMNGRIDWDTLETGLLAVLYDLEATRGKALDAQQATWKYPLLADIARAAVDIAAERTLGAAERTPENAAAALRELGLTAFTRALEDATWPAASPKKGSEAFLEQARAVWRAAAWRAYLVLVTAGLYDRLEEMVRNRGEGGGHDRLIG
jgi:hypothetical protein